ncbi:MAG: hypothetical protein QOD45_327 [Pseudonocardiales bacterium]|nr:hypothetical protein [Pseudonocardiales bacterium]
MAADPIVLLDVRRSGFTESHHRGSVVLLDAVGDVAVAAGGWDQPTLPRSAVKPMQTIALLGAGFDGPDDAVALASASHDGEPVHVDLARAVLAAAGLDERALQCPAQWPDGQAAMLARVLAGGGPSRLCHNCSGKHAAMLSTCVRRGWPVENYLDPQHPLQEAVRAAITTYTGEAIVASGVDGCGAPAHAVALVGLARAFARIATAPGATHAARVRDAMAARPNLLGGTGRAVSELTAAVPGLLCKDGSEGVWAAALPDGRAFAVKVDDGAMRALGPLLCAALRHWGVDDPVIDRLASVPVLGGGVPVGKITWSARLRELLHL